MKQICQIMLLFLAVTEVMTYNILLMITLASKSHKIAFDPIAEALAKKGHKVTVFSPMLQKQETPGVQQVYLENVAAIIDKANLNFFEETTKGIKLLTTALNLSQQVCWATFHGEPAITKLLADPKGHGYDVMIMDGAMNDWLLAIGHHLDIPIVSVMPAQMIPTTSIATNIPTPIYVGGLMTNNDMTFFGRLKNFLFMLGYSYFLDNYIFNVCDEIIREVLPESPPIAVLEKKISFLLSNSHTSTHVSIPTMPYFVEVGCLHCKEAKPLPQELEEFMQSSGDAGVIYFSLGSITGGADMPLDMRDKLIRVFSRLPQKILWKYENEVEGLPRNIKLTKWAPQQDILAHNKTRLFISHGGGLSTFEAVYHSCPVLGIPLAVDQWSNIAKAMEKGYAESLDWRVFTEDELHEKINLMLLDNRFQINVDYLSKLLKDRPQEPVDTAVYWIEYVVRHKGARHLKSGAEHLNFFQYFLLDVIGLILLAVSVFGILAYLAFRKCLRMFFKERGNKLKNN